MRHAREDYNNRIQDSLNVIPFDEPVILIRGQDRCALAAISAWIEAAQLIDVDRSLISALSDHAKLIRQWQEEQGSKVPDAPLSVL